MYTEKFIKVIIEYNNLKKKLTLNSNLKIEFDNSYTVLNRKK